jgi:hypothetical protein
MSSAITMAFFMRCLRKNLFEKLLLSICFWAWVAQCSSVWAQNQVELSQLEVERSSEEVSLTAQLQFELSSAVEDALLKGVPVYFRAEAEVLKERWYWYDKSLASVSRQYKLAFQPLTRRWRLNVGVGSGASAGQGLALSQTFDSLSAALASVKRISKWRVAGATDLDPAVKYRLDFRFQLDVSQLPRPFQIGVMGHTDWDVGVARSVPLAQEGAK